MSATDLREQLQQTLGDAYALEQELGGGGMSRVFVATETALGRRVVVKVLPAEIAGQLSTDRFKREISIAARLQHPHIVPLLTAGQVEGLPYFTMPFIDGESLRARLARHGELPLTDAVRMLREIASALAYAHAHEVVHRDIKPDNVLLSGGAAMVTDFGVAKALAAGQRTDDSPESHGITSVGMALGTPAYMAPEQAAADPQVDHRADIYSWGMLAYEVITGQSPFAGRTPQAMLAAHVTEAPEQISRRRASLPPALSTLVMQTLEKRPSDRPQRADDLVRALDGIAVSSGSGTPIAPAISVKKRISGRTVAMIASGIVLLVLAGIALAKRNPSGRSAGTGAMTLAVLPIENLGGDSSTEYLADGMTGELASALKKVPGLEVVGDLSTARFKGKQVAPAEIARDLGVRMLLTGKLQAQQGRIRLQMQLSDPQGKLLWSNKFDRDTRDNFAMQDEITSAIASEMQVALSPTALAVAHAGRTINPEAHDLFLRGQFEKNKLTPNGLERAQEYFRQALKLDPDYAQAHEGLAFTYDIQADVYAPSHEYHTLALNEAKLAVAADSLYAEGRVLYGFELAAARWDFAAGKAEMNRGLALNPNAPDALLQLTMFSMLSGDSAQALALSEHLLKLDPLSALAARTRADALLWAGRNQEALQQHAAANKLDPSVMLIDATDGNALRELGRFDESVAAFLAFKNAFDLPSFGLMVTYAKMGRRDDALREIHALELRSQKQWVDPDFVAIGYAAIGDKDQAMAWLDKAFEMKTFGLRLFLNWDMPGLRGVKDDPRFIALKKRVLATTFDS